MWVFVGVGCMFGLGCYVYFGCGEEVIGGCDKDLIFVDIVEVLFGVVYFDYGISVVVDFVYCFVDFLFE